MIATKDARAEFPELEPIGAGQAFSDDLCEKLANCQLFKDLNFPEIKQLARYVQAYRANPGVTLFREGEPGQYLCLLLAGRADIVKEDSHAQAKVVAQVPAGRTLGEMAVIDGERRSATCVFAEPAELAILTKANFERMADDHPALGYRITHRIARLLSQRLRLTSGQLVDYLAG